MDQKRAMRLADSFLTGAFQSLNALLGSTFVRTTRDAKTADASRIATWCQTYPVWFYVTLDGGGAAALLWTKESAASLVAMVGGEDPATRVTVTADDSAMLQELSDTIGNGGATALGGLLVADATVENAGYVLDGNAAALQQTLGDGLVGAKVEFKDEKLSGDALFVYSSALEKRTGASGAPSEEPLVSDEEVRDILQDFTPDDETDHGARRNGGPTPENLDVVMDIELLVTARLGKVEVPISEVLHYGPGSIIELGHVVDEPIELLVNGKLIARGDVVVVDERFGLRITEIVSPRERIESLR